MNLWKYVYRTLTEPPTRLRSPVFNYAMLAVILLLLARDIYWRNNLPPDYRGDRFGNAVVVLMGLFNLLAFQFHWPVITTVLLRTLAFIWLVFGSIYTFQIAHIPFRNGSFSERVRHGDQSTLPVVVQAVEAIDRFHSRVKQQRYQDICQASESHAFLSVTSLSCPEFLSYFHQKLGDPVRAKRAQLPLIGGRRLDSTVPVELHYDTDYKHGVAHERFDWWIKGKAAILRSYSVEADALSQ